ncbi:MAG: hypothetical protein ABH826_00995 [Patescibacteria group bacterium]|nr:hypothetical protein [Patescibacteria group bacterium]
MDSFILLTGIVLTLVPLALIIGFSFFIFLSFIRDDDDAGNLLRLTFIVLIFGLVFLLWYFIKRNI